MKNDRLGLLLVAASLVAIAVVSGLTYHHQQRLRHDEARVHGVAIARAIAAVESDGGSLAPAASADKLTLLRNLANIQNNDDLSYIVVVNRAGEKLHEIASPGAIVPFAAMPSEPFAWFGEHNLVSPGDGREIREFYAPIVQSGLLAGFVRAGYYGTSDTVFAGQLSAFGLTALPIFLLTALSYLLIRREIQPLQRLGDKLQSVARSYGPAAAASYEAGDRGDFIQRFDNFIQLVQSRVQHLNAESMSLQATSRLISYQQEKAETALNTLPDAVLILDDAGIPTFASHKVASILNRSHDEIVGRPPQEWCDNTDILSFMMRHRQATSALRATSLQYVPAHLPARHMEITALPLYSPRDRSIFFGMLFAFRDVTREHLARDAGTEFVSHVSHELKTPLSTLMACSELLMDRATLSESDTVSAVNAIHAEAGRMASLINNLLNISKMESGTLRPERNRVKLHDLIQGAFESQLGSAVAKGVELELSVPPDLGSIRLDKNLFRIAIDNLLSNAIKYSNPGGKVTVSATTLDDDRIQIKVRDHGIGIAAEDCDRIFAKYFRAANAATEARSGHGLGLYLAKQIVELHQGDIGVSSELGKGTEFVIKLKARPMQLEVSEVA